MLDRNKKSSFRVDLTGQRFGALTVLGHSEKRGPRGSRTVPLWECRCDCGEVVYKATDTLRGRNNCMCSKCASRLAAEKMRASAGFVDGTQISRIKSEKISASNTSGARGVYYEKRSGRWRARLKFKGKLMDFGSYEKFEDAVKARKDAEELYYKEFLETRD